MAKTPREYFESKFEEQLSEYAAQIEVLKNEMEDTEWEPKLDFEKRIEELLVQWREVKQELEALKTASRTAWRAQSDELARTMRRFASLLECASSDLHKALLE